MLAKCRMCVQPRTYFSNMFACTLAWRGDLDEWMGNLCIAWAFLHVYHRLTLLHANYTHLRPSTHSCPLFRSPPSNGTLETGFISFLDSTGL
jgi:hypothetical protein